MKASELIRKVSAMLDRDLHQRQSTGHPNRDGHVPQRPGPVPPMPEQSDDLHKAHTRCVAVEVINERLRQNKKWGGPVHDDRHSVMDFVRFIHNYAGWAEQMALAENPEKARKRLVQVAALAVASVETLDRRHDPSWREAAKSYIQDDGIKTTFTSLE